MQKILSIVPTKNLKCYIGKVEKKKKGEKFKFLFYII